MSEAAGGEGSEIVYVALGANLGDCRATFASALEALAEEPGLRVLSASQVYETPPLGPEGQPPYLNAVLALAAEGIAPERLLERLQAIESELGRDRSPEAVRWGPRTLDLDILFFGDRVIERPALQVPHPRLHERAFVLVPLADLAPDLRHPRLGESVAALAAGQPDRDAIRRVEPPADWPAVAGIGGGLGAGAGGGVE